MAAARPGLARSRRSRALLIGPLSRPGELRSRPGSGRALLVAVDAGYARCREAGLVPDWAVGDWDSLPARHLRDRASIRQKTHWVTLARDKDWSDLREALRLVLRAGAREIFAIGFMGGRPDHHLAALFDLAWAARRARVRARGPDGQYEFVSPGHPWARKLARKRIVSILALGVPARGVRIRGLEFTFHGRLEPSSRGLSNRGTGSLARVSASAGVLVVIVPRV